MKARSLDICQILLLLLQALVALSRLQDVQMSQRRLPGAFGHDKLFNTVSPVVLDALLQPSILYVMAVECVAFSLQHFV